MKLHVFCPKKNELNRNAALAVEKQKSDDEFAAAEILKLHLISSQELERERREHIELLRIASEVSTFIHAYVRA